MHDFDRACHEDPADPSSSGTRTPSGEASSLGRWFSQTTPLRSAGSGGQEPTHDRGRQPCGHRQAAAGRRAPRTSGATQRRRPANPPRLIVRFAMYLALGLALAAGGIVAVPPRVEPRARRVGGSPARGADRRRRDVGRPLRPRCAGISPARARRGSTGSSAERLDDGTILGASVFRRDGRRIYTIGSVTSSARRLPSSRTVAPQTASPAGRTRTHGQAADRLQRAHAARLVGRHHSRSSWTMSRSRRRARGLRADRGRARDRDVDPLPALHPRAAPHHRARPCADADDPAPGAPRRPHRPAEPDPLPRPDRAGDPRGRAVEAPVRGHDHGSRPLQGDQRHARPPRGRRAARRRSPAGCARRCGRATRSRGSAATSSASSRWTPST